MTDEIMYELMLLSGQEYVDMYATKAKADIAEARQAAEESMVSSEGRVRRRRRTVASPDAETTEAVEEERPAS
ncbi:MAG TPA: 1-acyl-sn-glycerol-3-phosphate acyltransferase, partial [Frankiaceae bacterium]|nr:1-acyl-sn-glycerol-3-phosphate acyltransferase [Frankiaceae bacterium]